MNAFPDSGPKPGLNCNKVPAASLVFWIIKILATTVGETGADYLSVNVGLGAGWTGLMTSSCLLIAITLQFRSRCYVPWVYWLTVVLISIVGTQLTDFLTDKLDISLYTTTAVFTVLLLATFATWFAVERTLSIHTIDTRRREKFYWAVILFTFALGTASGDLATEAAGLGFTVGVVVFSGLIAAIYLACWLGADPVLCFWLAYILTRPLGASLGDLLSQSTTYGGLGWGTVVTSTVFLAVIVLLVGALTYTKRSDTIGARL